jgi:hypothetical protein
LYQNSISSVISLWIFKLKTAFSAGHQRLTPVILATQEAEIRRILVRSQPRQNSSQDPILKIPITKKD